MSLKKGDRVIAPSLGMGTVQEVLFEEGYFEGYYVKFDSSDDGKVIHGYDHDFFREDAVPPRPQCCEQMREQPCVWLAFDRHDEVLDPTRKPVWTLSIEQALKSSRRYTPALQDKWYKEGRSCCSAPATFCPFCGTALPDIELKDPLPEPLARSKDGCYCDNCNESNRCRCFPPASAWKLKGETSCKTIPAD